MTQATIQNGCNVSLAFSQGTVPDMGEALTDWFQALSFVKITKTVVGFEVSEVPVTTNFWGIFHPAGPRDLKILPEAQRAWTIFRLYAQPVLTLQVDDVVVFPQINNKQTRVMSREDFGLFGYISYTLCQDWTGSGP